jgi:hypothetical protein
MASKNQRAGAKQAQRENLCDKGHTRVWVRIANRGRMNMRALCECDGYTPITKER